MEDTRTLGTKDAARSPGESVLSGRGQRTALDRPEDPSPRCPPANMSSREARARQHHYFVFCAVLFLSSSQLGNRSLEGWGQILYFFVSPSILKTV